MDPLTAGCIVAASSVTAGFIVYKVVPELYNGTMTIINTTFYKTVIMTIAQNKIKVLNIIKYISRLKQDMNTLNSKIIIDNQEYTVPIVYPIYIYDVKKHYMYYLKVNIDNTGNIISITMSTYKRWGIFFTDTDRIAAFDNFLDGFDGVITDNKTKLH